MKKLKPNQHIISGHTVTEKGILFSTEMVKAILEDRKTQTRRTKGLDKYPELDWINIKSVNGVKIRSAMADMPNKYVLIRSPYGQPGDLLYVRETWSKIEMRTYYKADGAEDELLEEYGMDKIQWKPSLHLPKAGSRIWVMIEDIRVERVHDITEEDAIAEGIEKVKSSLPGKEFAWGNYNLKDDDCPYFFNPRHSFESLWISINGRTSWDANPWVWVVKFRMLSKTGRPSDEVISSNLEEIINHKSEIRNGEA